jgi:hypothetical protein
MSQSNSTNKRRTRMDAGHSNLNQKNLQSIEEIKFLGYLQWDIHN